MISDPTIDGRERQAIVDLSYAYAAGIDQRDWSLYRSIFTDVCEFDFSSWSGRPAAAMPADDWVQAVRSVNGNFDATQHLMSNHRLQRVDDDTIVGVNELQAQHWFDAESMSSFGRSHRGGLVSARRSLHEPMCANGPRLAHRRVSVDRAVEDRRRNHLRPRPPTITLTPTTPFAMRDEWRWRPHLSS